MHINTVVYNNVKQWQAKDFDLNSANGFQVCTTQRYKFNSKFCIDTKFQAGIIQVHFQSIFLKKEL